MMNKITTQRLGELINAIPASRLNVLAEMATALQRAVDVRVSSDTDIVNESFQENFSARLLLFHAMHDASLTKKTFEYFFGGASAAAGRSVTHTENTTHSGEDVIVDGVRFSLKTEGSKSMRPKYLHISKLMEARWIRDCKTGTDFYRATQSRVLEHLRRYDRIVSLRSFQTEKHVDYELVEVPRSLLERVESLRPADFSTRTSNGSSRATIRDDQGRGLWVLSLDGSVEKVTVRNLDIDHCRVHALWRIVLYQEAPQT